MQVWKCYRKYGFFPDFRKKVPEQLRHAVFRTGKCHAYGRIPWPCGHTGAVHLQADGNA